MTADQIREAVEDFRSDTGWLKEIAWQLARLNEREQAKQAAQPSSGAPDSLGNCYTRAFAPKPDKRVK